MAKIVSLEIKTTDVYGKVQKNTVSYVNPEVKNDKLREFAQMLTALTTHTYNGTSKITKESVI